MDVRIETRGPLGVITLAAPQRLNALSPDMCAAIGDALARWSKDDAIKAALIKSDGGKAFCAGGDIRRLYDLRKSGDFKGAMRFFATEYRNNWRIFRFAKPYIALIDGIVMGGGVGVSAHGRYRVATERAQFAMPECAIGMYPDVGATYVLPRLPGEAGTYLGLTGVRVGWADMLALGLATHAVRSERLPDLERALAEADYGLDDDEGAEVVEEILERFHQPPEEDSPLTTRRFEINEDFGRSSIEAIQAALAARDTDWAREALASMARACPMSLRLTLDQMREGGHLDFDAAMRREFRVTWRVVEGANFMEGVRALIVDKDKSPKWRPETLAEATPADAKAYAAPLGPGRELPLDWSEPTAAWPEALE